MTSPWKFDPWIPERADFRGLRLLLVGESHYDKTRDLPKDFTREVVANYGVANDSGATKLFRNAYAAFTGDFDVSREGKALFWSSVCFCNYFQRVMWPSGEKPTEQDFAESASSFDALLAHIRPDCFVIMSTRLWIGMKNKCARLPPIGPLNGNDAFEFAIGDASVPAIHISHPSPAAGVFPAQKWHPHIVEFLNYVKANRAGG